MEFRTSKINNSVSSDKKKLLLFNMKNGKTVDENLLALISKIGEKITIGRSKTLNNSNSKVFKLLIWIQCKFFSSIGVL